MKISLKHRPMLCFKCQFTMFWNYLSKNMIATKFGSFSSPLFCCSYLQQATGSFKLTKQHVHFICMGKTSGILQRLTLPYKRKMIGTCWSFWNSIKSNPSSYICNSKEEESNIPFKLAIPTLSQSKHSWDTTPLVSYTWMAIQS
jgi:hypothetical protein